MADSNSSKKEYVMLEMPVSFDIEHPDLINAIRLRHPGMKMLYRDISRPELYLGDRDRVFRGLELLRHMYLKSQAEERVSEEPRQDLQN